MKLTNKLAHYGDLIAIPCFVIAFFYFYNIPNKTLLENLIMLFLFIALIADILFSLIFFRKN